MSWWLWVLAGAVGLAALALVAAGIILAVAKRAPGLRYQVLVDGVPLAVRGHFDAWLPRWLGTQGFAMDRDFWMYWSRYDAMRTDVAHELLHLIRVSRIGWWRFRVQAVVEWATQWTHNRREMEEEARRGAPMLAETCAAPVMVAGRMVFVDAPWLQQFRLR